MTGVQTCALPIYSLAQQKGVERNLLIKNFIKNIIYSKEQIQINFYYSKDFGDEVGVSDGEKFVNQKSIYLYLRSVWLGEILIKPACRQTGNTNHTEGVTKVCRNDCLLVLWSFPTFLKAG